VLGFVWGSMDELMEPRSTSMDDRFEWLALVVEDMLLWNGKSLR